MVRRLTCAPYLYNKLVLLLAMTSPYMEADAYTTVLGIIIANMRTKYMRIQWLFTTLILQIRHTSCSLQIIIKKMVLNEVSQDR